VNAVYVDFGKAFDWRRFMVVAEKAGVEKWIVRVTITMSSYDNAILADGWVNKR